MTTGDLIVDISPAREKFFGCSGKMLIPSAATVDKLLREIPKSKVTTTTLLGKELASRFQVQATCPISTGKALKAIARDTATDAPYWRVLRPKGELLAIFPGGPQAQAERLAQEEIAIDTAGKTPRVTDLAAKLVQFNK